MLAKMTGLSAPQVLIMARSPSTTRWPLCWRNCGRNSPSRGRVTATTTLWWRPRMERWGASPIHLRRFGRVRRGGQPHGVCPQDAESQTRVDSILCASGDGSAGAPCVTQRRRRTRPDSAPGEGIPVVSQAMRSEPLLPPRAALPGSSGAVLLCAWPVRRPASPASSQPARA